MHVYFEIKFKCLMSFPYFTLDTLHFKWNMYRTSSVELYREGRRGDCFYTECLYGILFNICICMCKFVLFNN